MAVGRYVLFAGRVYYPEGGWDDYWQSGDNLDSLRLLFRERVGLWYRAPNGGVYREHCWRIACRRVTRDGEEDDLTGEEIWGHIVDMATHTVVFEAHRRIESGTEADLKAG